MAVVAHAYVLDVSDAEAVEAFAERVSAEHGVPDIVVNNAGIGQAGGFLDTPAEQFDRVLDVNLGGVVNGCRSFGRRLVERGTGGHIVNVSSMAAYAPLQSLSAYCTLQGRDLHVLRLPAGRTRRRRIGLTTICPVSSTPTSSRPPDRRAVGKSEQVDDRGGSWTSCSRCATTGRKVANAILSGQEEQADSPGRAGSLCLLRHLRLVPQALRSTARLRVI